MTENKVFEDGQLIVRLPAKAVRSLTPEQIADLEASAARYVENAQRFAAQLKYLD